LATYTSADLSKEVFYELIYILSYLFDHKLWFYIEMRKWDRKKDPMNDHLTQE
jgi:hypothetical protein